MTRLSRIHPYPAMIADGLATELAEKFTDASVRVVDPFCGTGRTLLAAAQKGATAVGVDVNPLACLITKAKAARIKIVRLEGLLGRLPYSGEVLGDQSECAVDKFDSGRKVEWFAARVKQDLWTLVDWL